MDETTMKDPSSPSAIDGDAIMANDDIDGTVPTKNTPDAIPQVMASTLSKPKPTTIKSENTGRRQDARKKFSSLSDGQSRNSEEYKRSSSNGTATGSSTRPGAVLVEGSSTRSNSNSGIMLRTSNNTLSDNILETVQMKLPL